MRQPAEARGGTRGRHRMSWKDAGAGWVGWRWGRGGGRRAAWGVSMALALLCLSGCSTTGLPPDLAAALETPGALLPATPTATASATATPTTTATTTATTTPTPTE